MDQSEVPQKPKNKGGRPRKFNDHQIEHEIIPKYLDFCKQGFPDKAIAGEFNVAVDYWIELEKRSKKFSEARKLGAALRESFFYKMALASMQGQVENFNPTTYIWLTRNILKWRNEEPSTVSVETENAAKVVFRSSLEREGA